MEAAALVVDPAGSLFPLSSEHFLTLRSVTFPTPPTPHTYTNQDEDAWGTHFHVAHVWYCTTTTTTRFVEDGE